MKRNSFYIVLVAIVAFCGRAPAADPYSIVNLGPGVAHDVNSAGHVLAEVAGDPVLFNGLTNRVLPPAETGYGPHTFTPIAINNADEVLMNQDGRWVNLSGTNLTFYNGVFTSDVLTDINNLGFVTGYHYGEWLAHSYSLVGVPGNPDTFVFFPDYFSNSLAINDHGVAVGIGSTNFTSWDYGPQRGIVDHYHPGRACRIVDGSLEFIDPRPVPDKWPVEAFDHLSAAESINNVGEMAGWMRQELGGARHAFYYGGTTMIDLGTLGGNESVALGINVSGEIVGWANTPSGAMHAFISSGGVMTDLNDLLPEGSGWVLNAARALNDNGLIVGEGTLGGVTHAYLLVPPNLGEPPFITEHPKGAVVGLGASYSLSVDVLGTPPFTFQWLKDGEEIPGATESELLLTSLTAFDSGGYRVRITNGVATQTSNVAPLEVADPMVDIATFSGISVFGEVGGTYQVEYKDDVEDEIWTSLGEEFVLTASPQLVMDPTPIQHKRIYQARRVE